MKIPWYLMAKGKGGGTKTASGPIAHWTDGVDAPLKSLLVNIDPVQDLHGYDNPWPAGGGKNLFNKEDYEYKKYLNQNNGTTITSTGNPTWDTSGYIKVTPGTTYVTSPWTARLASEWCFYDADKVFISGKSDGTRTATAPENAAYVRVDFTHTVLDTFQLEEGSTATAYAPYSNICPISGWDGMTVYHSGADTSDPTTYPISWQSAGTVYGGTLNVTNGVLTVDRASVDLGSFNWIDETAYVPGLFRVNSDQTMTLGARYSSVLCSILKGTSPKRYQEFKYGEIGLSNDPNSQILRASAVSFEGASAASVKEFFTGQTLVYELATPIEYTLTPQQISSLVGENNVWADTGDVTVEYESSGGSDPNLMKLAVAFMGRE